MTSPEARPADGPPETCSCPHDHARMVFEPEQPPAELPVKDEDHARRLCFSWDDFLKCL